MSKHTPGPWGIERKLYRESIRIIGEECTPIANVYATIGGSTGTQTMEANAALIAAAPALADALEAVTSELADWLNQDGGCDHSVGICYCSTIRMIEHARAALKRAGR